MCSGSQVLCRIDRLQTNRADVSVIAVILGPDSMVPVKSNHRGSIRIQDVRSFDVDKASIEEHFLPGDIVRALTLVAGDAKSCLFSTVGSEYGVVKAKDDQGNELFPLDESHMKNSSGLVFRRKVAKPQWLIDS